MSDPTTNPAAVALADALLKLLTDQIVGSFEKRLSELEAKLEDSKFDEAVIETISSDPGAVVDAIEDELKGRSDDKVADTVADVIRSGSFSIDFNP